jgi:tetratricopeptide (TPR) repeat protein
MDQKLQAAMATAPPPAAPGPCGSGAAEFKVHRSRILAGAGVGALLGLAGLCIVVGVLESGSNPAWALLGLGFLLAGGCLFLLMKILASLRVWVSPEGFVVATLGRGRWGRCFRIESEEPAGTARTSLGSGAGHASACWSRGLGYSAQGEYDKALAELDEAIRLDPHLTAAYHARAAVHAYKGDYEKAMADYATARQALTHVKAG